MLSRSAVLRAFRSSTATEPVALPLVFAWAARVVPCDFKEMVSEASLWTRAVSESQRLLQYDWVLAHADSGFTAEALGCELRWTQHGDLAGIVPKLLEQALPSPERVPECGRLPVALESARRLVAMVGRKTATAVALMGPVKLASLLAGGSVGDLPIDYCSDVTLQVVKQFCEARVDIVVIVDRPTPSPDRAAMESSYERLARVVRFYGGQPVFLIQGEGTGCATASSTRAVLPLPSQSEGGRDERASLAGDAFCLPMLECPAVQFTGAEVSPELSISGLQELVRNLRQQ